MTFAIGLHEVCVRTGVRYVITKFSGMDSLPNFLTHGAPLHSYRSHDSTSCHVTARDIPRFHSVIQFALDIATMSKVSFQIWKEKIQVLLMLNPLSI